MFQKYDSLLWITEYDWQRDVGCHLFRILSHLHFPERRLKGFGAKGDLPKVRRGWSNVLVPAAQRLVKSCLVGLATRLHCVDVGCHGSSALFPASFDDVTRTEPNREAARRPAPPFPAGTASAARRGASTVRGGRLGSRPRRVTPFSHLCAPAAPATEPECSGC
jgi:hypothetical protein